MAMSRRIGRELYMLRGIAAHFLTQHTCMLCQQALLVIANDSYSPGNQPVPIEGEYTEHHADGNHDNNAPSNRAIVHRSCHKRYHMLLRKVSHVVAVKRCIEAVTKAA